MLFNPLIQSVFSTKISNFQQFTQGMVLMWDMGIS